MRVYLNSANAELCALSLASLPCSPVQCTSLNLATNFQALLEQENSSVFSPFSIRGGGGLKRILGFVGEKSSMFEILTVKVLVPAALMLGLLKRLELKRRMEEGPI